MYGTLATLSIDPSKLDAMRALMNEWSQGQGSSDIGFVARYILQTDADKSVVKMIAVFESEAQYRANGERPEQDAWYQKVRALLNSDPIWEDGTVEAT
jgi:quinol monooxygenase YgiN